MLREEIQQQQIKKLAALSMRYCCWGEPVLSCRLLCFPAVYRAQEKLTRMSNYLILCLLSLLLCDKRQYCQIILYQS